MALINCSECGKEMSDKAECCPHCGCKSKNKGEKKKLKTVLVVAIIAIITASVILLFTSNNTSKPVIVEELEESNWGVSLEEVERALTEHHDISIEDNEIKYTDTSYRGYENERAEISYCFNDKQQLVKIIIGIYDDEDLLDDSMPIVTRYTSRYKNKYGPADRVSENGVSVLNWKTEKTNIGVVVFEGVNSVLIAYTDINWEQN